MLPSGPCRLFGPQRQFTAAQQDVGNGGHTGRPAGDARTGALDPTADILNRSKTCEVALDFGYPLASTRENDTGGETPRGVPTTAPDVQPA